MRRRNLVVGAALLAVYLVVLALTVGLRSDHVRPLYDGFAPPPAYQWVEPPPFFASGNVEPKPVSMTVKVGRAGSAAAGIATPDGQFVINLPRGAVTPSAGAAKVNVRITPVAPSTLPPVPGGLRPNGNAYRVEMVYDTGKPVVRVERPGTLVVEIPELGDKLFFARRPGRSSGTVAAGQWTDSSASPVPPRQLSLAASFDGPGYFLAGTILPELVGPSAESSSNAPAIGIATAGLAVVLLGVAFVVVRRRARRP